MTGPEVRALVERHLRGGRPERAWDVLTSLYTDGASEPWMAAGRMLPWVAERMPGSAWTRARKAVARQAAVQIPGPRAVIGQADFPAVGPAGDRFVGATVMAGTGPAPAELPAETRAAIDDALLAARSYCGKDPPLRVNLSSGVGGRSCSLAVGLATISLLQGIPIGDGIVASGDLRADGTVGPVEEIGRKLALRASARPGAVLLVPPDVHSDFVHVAPVRTLAEAAAWIRARPSFDLQEDLHGALLAFSQARLPEAARSALRLVDEPGLFDDERAGLLAILLAVANHAGDTAGAERWSGRIGALAEARVPSHVLVPALSHCAVAAIDCFDRTRAALLLQRAEALHDRADKTSGLHLRGTQALLAVLEGQLDLALSLREENLCHASEDELPRGLGDLADTHLRRGDRHAARAAIEQALQVLTGPQRRRHGYIRRTEPHLRLHAARICRALGESKEGLHHAAQGMALALGPDPRFRLELEQALLQEEGASGVTRRWAEMRGELGPSPIFHALFLRACLEGGDLAPAKELARLMGLDERTEPSVLCLRLPY